MQPNKDTQPNDAQRLLKLVEGIQLAMMTTVSAEDQSLRSRPMTLQAAEASGDFWFFTGKIGGPADDIHANPRVNLAFSDPGKSSYVSVAGVAELNHDMVKARELWSPAVKAFFPQGITDPNLALIRVRVESADFWESPSSKVVQLAGFAKAILQGHKARGELGFHRHLDMH